MDCSWLNRICQGWWWTCFSNCDGLKCVSLKHWVQIRAIVVPTYNLVLVDRDDTLTIHDGNLWSQGVSCRSGLLCSSFRLRIRGGMGNVVMYEFWMLAVSKLLLKRCISLYVDIDLTSKLVVNMIAGNWLSPSFAYTGTSLKMKRRWVFRNSAHASP